jgi:hypothetical protein
MAISTITLATNKSIMKEGKVIAYFENLGKLFYAIAAVDKKIQSEEIEVLNQLIEDYWTDCDAIEGFSVRDPAYHIIITFEKLYASNIDSASAFSEFEALYKSDNTFFTKSVKYTIILTAEAIAKAFAKKNKTETRLLTQLKLLFDKT